MNTVAYTEHFYMYSNVKERIINMSLLLLLESSKIRSSPPKICAIIFLEVGRFM